MGSAGSPVSSTNSEEEKYNVTERINSRRRGRMLADDHRSDEVHYTSYSLGHGNLNSSNSNVKKTMNAIKNDKFDEVIEISDGEGNSSLDSAFMDEEDDGPHDEGDSQTNKTNNLKNDPYDEVYDISRDGDSVASSVSTPQEFDVEEEQYKEIMKREVAVPLPIHNKRCVNGSDNDNASEHDSSFEELSMKEGPSTTTPYKLKGTYDPETYAHLDVSSEVKGLFEYISGYKPQHIELESTLKCFIPGYIPAIGNVDPFVKIPRPDGKANNELGLKLIDEPSAYQSDPNILELHLRSISKIQHGELAVKSIENAHKRPEEIERWISSIDELHRSKHPLQVYHNRLMPDFKSLMEVWPEEMENILNKIPVSGKWFD